jgi:hypothetical protein
VLASLQGKLCLGLAGNALQSQHNLLCGLGLLVEDRLSLTTVTGLLTVVSALSLCEKRGLWCIMLDPEFQITVAEDRGFSLQRQPME